MSDQFFKDPRPFTKRKREEGPNAAGAGRSGSGSGRSFGERGGRGGSRGSDRGGRGSRGSSRGDRGSSRGARGGGRGGRGAPVVESGNSKRRAQEIEDEELDEPGAGGGGFDSDEALGEDAEEEEEDSSEEEDDVNETPAQKRLRLSQMYLKTLEKDTSREDIGFNAADLDRDLIAERLQQDVLEHSGKLHLNIGESLLLPIPSSSIHFTPSAGHRGPVTAAVATEDGSWLYTSSKDGSIIKWDLRPVITSSSSSSSSPSTSTPAPRILKAVYFPKKKGESANRNPEIRKQKDLLLEQEKAKARGKEKGNVKGKGKSKAEEIGGHTDEILTLAVSFDGKILASGGKDKVVGVWDVSGEDGKWMRGLGGHKDKVASIAFRQGTLQLYSSSFDRSVKLFDLSTLSYVETLFGHQDCIQHVAALRSELAVSAGGRDKTIRFWKIAEESQLVFRGGAASRIRNVLDGAMEDEGVEEEDLRKRKRNRGEVKYVEGSVDCVAMIDDTTFLSGGDSGSICLWNITKKKPISTHQLAHGVSEYTSETEGVIGTARWITALASLGYGDVFASGSWDGSIRLWKIDERVRSFSLLTTIPAPGYINSLQLISPSLRSSEPQSQRQANGKEAKPTKSLVVIAAVAKEPRLGRWMRIKGGKEGALVAVIELGEGARITEDDA